MEKASWEEGVMGNNLCTEKQVKIVYDTRSKQSLLKRTESPYVVNDPHPIRLIQPTASPLRGCLRSRASLSL